VGIGENVSFCYDMMSWMKNHIKLLPHHEGEWT